MKAERVRELQFVEFEYQEFHCSRRRIVAFTLDKNSMRPRQLLHLYLYHCVVQLNLLHPRLCLELVILVHLQNKKKTQNKNSALSTAIEVKMAFGTILKIYTNRFDFNCKTIKHWQLLQTACNNSFVVCTYCG